MSPLCCARSQLCMVPKQMHGQHVVDMGLNIGEITSTSSASSTPLLL